MHAIDPAAYAAPEDDGHESRILILYGSLRERSFSRFAAEEAARVLRWFGAKTRVFDPTGLPLPDGAPEDHPKVAELRNLATWSEGMVWSSPERHGALTGVMKSQIDWIPLFLGGVRPTQGKTLALSKLCGGSQSFNSVNQMRILGRWIRMVTIPNQSFVPRAWDEFDDANRMRPLPLYMRIVDVIEEFMKFTLMTHVRSEALIDRSSERAESAEALSKRATRGQI